jgi:signal transduction histidine kinase/ActR/RegA family two-component response regulator
MRAQDSRAGTFRLLADVAAASGEVGDLLTLADRMKSLLLGALGVDHIGLWLAEPDGSLLRVAGTISYAVAEFRLPRDAELVRAVRARCEPVRVAIEAHPVAEAARRLAALGIRRAAMIPLLSGDRFSGLMGIGRRDDEELADLPDDLLLALGRAVGVALEQARLLAAARARSEFDRALLEAAGVAASSFDLEPVIAKYAEALVRVVGARRGAIALPAAGDPGTFGIRATWGEPASGEAGETGSFAIGAGHESVARALATKRLVVIERDEGEPAAGICRERFCVVLPLVVREVVKGLAVVSRGVPFEGEELGRLEAVSQEIALAVESASEREAARAASEREALEAELRAAVKGSYDLGSIFSSAVEGLGRHLGVDRCIVAQSDPERPGRVRVTHEYRDPPERAPAVGWTFERQDRDFARAAAAAPEVLVCHDVEKDPRFGSRERILPGDYRSFISVNFVDGTINLGGLLVGQVDRVRRWTDDEVRLVQAIVQQCAIAVARAEIFENANRRAEELELIVSQMTDGLIMYNERLEVVRMNPAARTMLWAAEPIPGTPLMRQPGGISVHALDGTLVEPADYPIARAVFHGEVVRDRELVIRRAGEGREVGVAVSSAPVRDSSGKLVGGISIFKDVTRARAAAAHASRTEKLRVLGELAAGVAHDVNNALAAILGNAEVIATATREPATRRGTEVVLQAARDASLLLGRLTRLSQKSHAAAPRHRVDLVQAARDSVELTRSRWSAPPAEGAHRIAVVVSAPRAVTVLGVASELREVFTNLILNALDALGGGGRVEIAVRQVEREAVVEVTDDGLGMPAEVLQHAFEPFFTTKGELGTGLGLSISAAIVEGHGGRIDARSSPGKGTSIRISLPAVEDDATPLKPGRVTPPPQHVLVVDDDARVRAILADLVAGDGHRVRTAASGAEALVHARDGTVPIDLLVTDVSMPGMSGWVLAEEIGVLRPSAAIVMVSGWPASATPDALGRLRAAFLAKPFRAEDVRAALAAALALRSSASSRPAF